MENSARNYKRSNYFIDKDFQAKFIARFFILIAAMGLVTGIILYILSMQSTSVALVNSRVVVRSTADFMLPLLVQTVAVVIIVTGIAMAFLTLFVSHKIAGPMYRFKKVAESLAEGDFSSDFKIRKLDQFQDLADAFNSTIASLRKKLIELKQESAVISGKLEGFSEQDISENKRASLAELKKIARQLKEAADYFKV